MMTANQVMFWSAVAMYFEFEDSCTLEGSNFRLNLASMASRRGAAGSAMFDSIVREGCRDAGLEENFAESMGRELTEIFERCPQDFF